MKKLTDVEIKKVSSEILSKFDSFCNENNLLYSVSFGTMIGTVRHGGYIPWDDDIDVVMPREDYEIMIEISRKEKIGENLDVFFYRFDKAYSILKIVDTRTLLIEKYFDNSSQYGVYIDVFPLDNCVDQDDFEKRNYKMRKLSKNFFRCSLTAKREENILKKITKMLRNSIWRLVYNREAICKEIEKTEQLYRTVNTKYVADFAAVSLPSMYEKAKLKVIRAKFENFNVNIFENYDDILKRKYGNYMELPPKEKQITHHDFEAFWR